MLNSVCSLKNTSVHVILDAFGRCSSGAISLGIDPLVHVGRRGGLISLCAKGALFYRQGGVWRGLESSVRLQHRAS